MINIYKETLLDHYKTPRNRGTLLAPDFSSGQFNPLCGDAVSMQGHIKDGIITQVRFEGKGCVISQATASLLTEYVTNMPIFQVEKLSSDDILKLIGITLGPTRLQCALLPLKVLQKGINA